MSVLHRQIIDAEHLHMARLAYELRSTMPARQLREIRVDSIVFQPGRKATEVVKRIETLTHAMLQSIPKDHAYWNHQRTHSEMGSSRKTFRVKSIQAKSVSRYRS